MRCQVALASAALLLAGCAGAPDETAPDPLAPCEDVVTVHYERAPEQAQLRDAFERAGYAWTARSERIAEATSPAGGVIVLSHQPGLSGDDLVLSASGPDARAMASAGAALVNATADDARVERWVEDERC